MLNNLLLNMIAQLVYTYAHKPYYYTNTSAILQTNVVFNSAVNENICIRI